MVDLMASTPNCSPHSRETIRVNIMVKMIKVWGIGEEYPDKMIGQHTDESQLEYLKLLNGNYIENCKVQKISMGCKPERIDLYDVIFTDRRIPIVSHKIANAMVKMARGSVQMLPTVLDFGHSISEDYWTLNITKLVEVVNLEKSTYIPFTGTNIPMKFIKIVCNQHALDSDFIARDLNCRSSIFINTFLVNKLNEISRNALCFYEPSIFFD